MIANERQVGGDHYKIGGEEHWDRVQRLGLDYFQAQITKYVERAWKKNGLQDLEKARHFLDKYIEIHKDSAHDVAPQPIYTFREVEEKGHAHIQDSDKFFSNEGFFGDNSQLYKCRVCKETFRAANLLQAHVKHATCVMAETQLGLP